MNKRIEDVAEIGKIGDTLLVRASRRLSAQEFKRIKENLLEAFPDNEMVLVDGGLDISVLRGVEIDVDKIINDLDIESQGKTIREFLHGTLKRFLDEFNKQLSEVLNGLDVQEG